MDFHDPRVDASCNDAVEARPALCSLKVPEVLPFRPAGPQIWPERPVSKNGVKTVVAHDEEHFCHGENCFRVSEARAFIELFRAETLATCRAHAAGSKPYITCTLIAKSLNSFLQQCPAPQTVKLQTDCFAPTPMASTNGDFFITQGLAAMLFAASSM